MSDIIEPEFPKTLYVKEENCYPYRGLFQLVGRASLEASVPDNDEENIVGVYQLVSVNRYKKTVTRTAVVEEIKR